MEASLPTSDWRIAVGDQNWLGFLLSAIVSLTSFEIEKHLVPLSPQILFSALPRPTILNSVMGEQLPEQCKTALLASCEGCLYTTVVETRQLTAPVEAELVCNP